MSLPVAEAVLHALANPVNANLITALEEGPSYPRALAARTHISEGQAQKHLRALADIGLVESSWAHDGKTVKRYALCVRGIGIRFHHGIEITLERSA